jgi:hypothetical protein
MSFTRVKPSNWPHGGTMSSDEANALDIDHANALDKTDAGDSISGPIVLVGPDAGITAGADTFIEIKSGAEFIVDAGASFAVNAAVNFNAAVTFASTIGVTGLSTLTGGANIGTHNIAFNPARAVIRVQNGGVDSDNWDAATGPGWGANSTAQGAIASYPLQFEIKVPNGATLTSVTVWLTGNGHSLAPHSMPQLKVYSFTKLGVLTQLGTTATDTSATPDGDPTGYDVAHALTVSGLSTVIDRTANRYVAMVFAEGGTHAQIGSPYVNACITQCTQSNYEED